MSEQTPKNEPLGATAKKALLIVSLCCGILTLGVFIYLMIPKPILTKEIPKWRFALFTDQVTGKTTDFGENKCPTFGSYPVFLDVGLMDHKKMANGKDNPHQKLTNQEEFLKAIPFWNRVAKEEGLGGKFVEPYSPELVARYRANPSNMETLHRWRDKGSPRAWPIIVRVRPYSKKNYRPGGCEYYSLRQQKFFPEKLAAMHLLPPELGYLTSPVIKVCEDAYNQGVGHNNYGMGIMKNRAAQALRQFRLEGIGIHEVGHVIFGTGKITKSAWNSRGHAPTGVGEVMAPAPTQTTLSRHMRALLRERVIKPCKANGLVFTPVR